MTIFDLEMCVINDFYCCMDIFWENVGKDKDKVVKAVHNAKTKRALVSIITQYI